MHNEEFGFDFGEGEFLPTEQWEALCDGMQNKISSLWIAERELSANETMYLDLSARVGSEMAARWVGWLDSDINLSLVFTAREMFAHIKELRDNLQEIEKNDRKETVVPIPKAVHLMKDPNKLIAALSQLQRQDHSIQENPRLKGPISKYAHDIFSLIRMLAQVRRGLLVDEDTRRDMAALINAYALTKEE